MSDDRWRERGEEIERLRRGDLPVIRVPLPQRIELDPTSQAADDVDALTAAAHADRAPWPAIVGAVVLAVLACIPHLVAPSVALLVALIAAPLSWSMQRITSGRRRRAYLTLAGTFVLVAALAIAAPIIWVQLGVIEWPTLPTG
ncbi:hypothetical protein [Agrococcus jejuensis]|uniref:Uncharacterized protein n=1 Tax=Agrococcus jejuensis TaxID=399736 RepID=A0A1G8C6J8_9MICO|nr:hypothetical protein [Agrococcus jejuensis]SDH40978.1 hypothetical protein SAMN04489720_1180 [Agrococcus jejuensis]